MILINHIIANPPYSLGNQITSTVLNNVDFDEYVNLMPPSEYSKKDLYEHIISSKCFYLKENIELFGAIINANELATLSKTKRNNFTKIDWICSRDSWLEDWHKRNMLRNGLYSVYGNVFRRGRCGKKDRPAAFDPDSFNLYDEEFFQSSIIFSMYFIASGIHNDNGDAWDLKWNYKYPHYKDFCDFILNTKDKNGNRKYNPDAHCLKFKTAIEKKNCWKWMSEGRLYSLILSKIAMAGTIDLIKEVTIPHVDWTREWTDEEILKDYGYTDEEIKELLK